MTTLLIAALLYVPVVERIAQVPAAVPSDADRRAVVAAVQQFFDTMADKDVEGSRRVLIAEGRFFRVRVPSGEVSTFAIKEYLDRLPGQKQRQRERFWDPEVRVQDGIAAVWTRYDFWIDGKFSHCGVDAFDLVKTPEGWKISGGLYTVQRDGCPPSPLGPLVER